MTIWVDCRAFPRYFDHADVGAPSSVRPARIDLFDHIVDPIRCKARNLHDLGFDCPAVNIVDDRAEPLFSRHWRRHFADEKARSGGPDVTGALVEEIIGFVQVAAGDEGNAMATGQIEELRTRLRLDRPIPGIALVRAVEKQRAVEFGPENKTRCLLAVMSFFIFKGGLPIMTYIIMLGTLSYFFEIR